MLGAADARTTIQYEGKSKPVINLAPIIISAGEPP
jgi:hypothetical protein